MEPVERGRVGDGTRLLHPQWLARESRSRPGSLFFQVCEEIKVKEDGSSQLIPSPTFLLHPPAQHILTGEVTKLPPGVTAGGLNGESFVPTWASFSSSVSSVHSSTVEEAAAVAGVRGFTPAVQQYRAPSKSPSDKARMDMILYFESLAR